jgi:hypothetical protein
MHMLPPPPNTHTEANRAEHGELSPEGQTSITTPAMPPSPPAAALSPPRPARLALGGVLLLGLVLGFVALFENHGSHPGAGQQPALATEVFGLDTPAATAAPAGGGGPSSEPSAAAAAAPAPNTNTTPAPSRAGGGSPTTTASTSTNANANSPSLFSALSTAAGLFPSFSSSPAEGAKDDVIAEADAIESGGFLSVKGCTPEDGKELRALVEGT